MGSKETVREPEGNRYDSDLWVVHPLITSTLGIIMSTLGPHLQCVHWVTLITSTLGHTYTKYTGFCLQHLLGGGGGVLVTLMMQRYRRSQTHAPPLVRVQLCGPKRVNCHSGCQEVRWQSSRMRTDRGSGSLVSGEGSVCPDTAHFKQTPSSEQTPRGQTPLPLCRHHQPPLGRHAPVNRQTPVKTLPSAILRMSSVKTTWLIRFGCLYFSCSG